MSTPEKDPRLGILNTLLTTPHRNLAQLWPVHAELCQKDPRFYVRLAAWYSDHGDVRDHKEMFVIALTLSEFDGHRDVGLALLRELPPYQVVRVIDFINGRKQTVKVKIENPVKPSRKMQRKRKLPDQATEKWESLTDEIGLFRNPPRSLRTEVTRYLREREADAEWFDSSVLVARKAMKRLYALLHVKPGARAQKILFENDPPADSRLFALKELARAKDPDAQAAAIVKNRIPFRIAATVIAEMTPALLVALVESMSPQELINSLSLLKRRRALADPQLKALVEKKLEEAKGAKRVAALKSEVAADAVAGLSESVRRKLEDVADAQVKAKGRITRPTALLIDKSGSMQVAIDLGKQIGSLISSVCEGGLFVYAFDTIAYPIEPGRSDLASWERALHGIKADGGTSCGVAIEWMRKRKQAAEQLILITDEEENTAPFFVDALKKYSLELGVEPGICIVRTPNGSNLLETKCREAGLVADVFQFRGDYYSLPNLIPMLARPSKMDLLMEILEYPLSQRRPNA